MTISVSEPGRQIARRLPFEHLHGDPAATLAQHWSDTDAFVIVLALGAAVRLLAPLLHDKASDPGVVCVDDAGTFSVALCGGHQGGANALARQVAEILGAQPVVTTATDRLGLPALDQLEGFRVEGDVAGLSGAMLAGERVRVEKRMDWPLPPTLQRALEGSGRSEQPQSKATTPAVLVVSDETLEEPGTWRTALLRPGCLVVGVGTTTDATADDVMQAFDAVLRSARRSPLSVSTVATIDRRAEHPAIVALAAHWQAEIVRFSAQRLDAIEVPTPSTVVAEAVGTGSVAEAAALAAAGPLSELIVPKVISPRVTIALARRSQPRGSLSIVGLGPGAASTRTPEATGAVRHAQVVVGLDAYVEQCADLLNPTQEVHRFPIGTEMERVELALECATQGHRVALVCSGDAGVYAMASPTLERAKQLDRFADLDITVVPGVTAGLAAAALLGAPLGHDFLTVSLSDLLTPWEVIESRIVAAARCDLVVVIYNPRSHTRTWQIEKARSILLEHRRADTPVGLVTNAGRLNQQVELTTLGELDLAAINMTTCVIIGGSTTRAVGGKMVTPRGYLQ